MLTEGSNLDSHKARNTLTSPDLPLTSPDTMPKWATPGVNQTYSGKTKTGHISVKSTANLIPTFFKSNRGDGRAIRSESASFKRVLGAAYSPKEDVIVNFERRRRCIWAKVYAMAHSSNQQTPCWFRNSGGRSRPVTFNLFRLRSSKFR